MHKNQKIIITVQIIQEVHLEMQVQEQIEWQRLSTTKYYFSIFFKFF